jgi:hypothetical protein
MGLEDLIKNIKKAHNTLSEISNIHIQYVRPSSPYIYEQPSSIIYKKSYKSYLKWLYTVYNQIAAKREPMLNKIKGKLSEYGLELDWIYGINCSKKISAVEYYLSSNKNYSYIIYYCGCVVILYDPQNCIQKYYNFHKVNT